MASSMGLLPDILAGRGRMPDLMEQWTVECSSVMKLSIFLRLADRREHGPHFSDVRPEENADPL